MIAVNCTLDINNYLYSFQPSSKLLNEEQVCFENIDFENNSLLSLSDYINYNYYTDLVFITNSTRLTKIVGLLDKLNNCRFHIYDENLEFVLGDKNIMASIKHKFLKNLEFKNVLEYYTWYNPTFLINSISGVYPLSKKSSLIKHLFIEDNVESLLHQSILNNLSLNGIIISTCKLDTAFVNMLLADYRYLLKSYNITEFNDEVKSSVKNFKETGRINNNNNINVIRNMNIHFGDFRLNRLYVDGRGIFLDSDYKFKVSNNINETFEELINQITLNYSKKSEDFYSYFYFSELLNISANFNSDNIYFITPYNNYYIDAITFGYKTFDLIGINDNGNCFIYTMKNHKVFQINKKFLFLLEYHLKDQLPTLVNKYPNKDKTVNKFLNLITKLT